MIKHIITRPIPLAIIVILIYSLEELAYSISQHYNLLFLTLVLYIISNIWWIIDMIIKYRRNEAGKCIFNLILIILPLLYWTYISYLGLFMYND